MELEELHVDQVGTAHRARLAVALGPPRVVVTL